MPTRSRAHSGCVARSSYTTRYAYRSRLASGLGGLQQNVTFIHYQALRVAELNSLVSGFCNFREAFRNELLTHISQRLSSAAADLGVSKALRSVART
jgi:hypothetical protein